MVLWMLRKAKKISFTGYIELCRYMLSMRPDGRRKTFMEGIFGWNYQVLQWNLMCRSINVDKLMFQHIIRREDCLVFTLPVSKCDQTGESVSKEFEKSRHGEFYRKTIMKEVIVRIDTVLFYCKH